MRDVHIQASLESEYLWFPKDPLHIHPWGLTTRTSLAHPPLTQHATFSQSRDGQLLSSAFQYILAVAQFPHP